MEAHLAKTTVSNNGVIILRDFPFRSGESVEVYVFPSLKAENQREGLRNTRHGRINGYARDFQILRRACDY